MSRRWSGEDVQVLITADPAAAQVIKVDPIIVDLVVVGK
jgi:hypothetical protein